MGKKLNVIFFVLIYSLTFKDQQLCVIVNDFAKNGIIQSTSFN